MVNYIEVFYESTDNYAGSLVKGKIVVKNPSSYTSVLMSVSGKAQSCWTDEFVNGRRRVHLTNRNTVKYIEAQKTVWSTAGNSHLPTDKQMIPFQYQLPQNIPPSFEGRFGWVRYNVGITLLRSGKCLAYQVVQLIVQERNNLLRLYQEPKSMDVEKRVKFFFFGVGSITATCVVPRTGFSPGESIPLTVHVENKTSRNIRVKSILVRHDTFISPQNLGRRAESEMAVATSPGIPGGQTIDVNFDALRVPKRASTTMKSCACISVEYSLLIKLVIPWSFNKAVNIPVVIANQAPPQAPPQAGQIKLTPQQAVGLLCSLLLKKQQQQQQVRSSNNTPSRFVTQQVGKEGISGGSMGAATPNPPQAPPVKNTLFSVVPSQSGKLNLVQSHPVTLQS